MFLRTQYTPQTLSFIFNFPYHYAYYAAILYTQKDSVVSTRNLQTHVSSLEQWFTALSLSAYEKDSHCSHQVRFYFLRARVDLERTNHVIPNNIYATFYSLYFLNNILAII